mgnify:CR=1 FL=1
MTKIMRDIVKNLAKLTIMRDCFHFVSLFKTLSRLMHEKMFLQQKGVVSPISKVSAVNSGCSPMTHEGKSRSAMLQKRFKTTVLYRVKYVIPVRIAKYVQPLII